MERRNVDLPQPDGPMMAVMDRGAIGRVIPERMRAGP
jgi:hypothetical protein